MMALYRSTGLICKIPSYQTLQYLGNDLKHKTSRIGLELVAIVLMFSFSNKKIFNRFHHVSPCKTCDLWKQILPKGYSLRALGEGSLDKATVKPQKLEHGNLRTLPKIRTKISVPTKKCS